MSLINEALKKAQRERARAAGGAAEAPSPAPVAPPQSAFPGSHRQVVPAGPPVGLILAGLAVMLAGLALVVALLRRPAPAPVVVQEPATPAPAAAVSAPALTQPVAQPSPAPAPGAPGGGGAQPVAGATPPPPAVAVVTPPPTVTVVPPAEPVAPTLAEPPAPAPAPAIAQAPQPAPTPVTDIRAAVEAWLEEITIQSVRLAGPDSRVLIRNRVYALGATVDRTLGLRVADIKPNQIVFIDDAGTEYTKSF